MNANERDAVNAEYLEAIKKSLSVIKTEMESKSKRVPKFLVTPERVEFLASSGMSIKNICSLFNKKFNFLSENPELKDAFDRGRAQAGAQVRARILDHAITKDNLNAQIYLDKILGGDQEVQKIEMNVTSSPLQDVPTEDLLEVMFRENGNTRTDN